MAEGLFRDAVAGMNGVTVSSAGISAGHGQPPSFDAVEALTEEGIDIRNLRSDGLTLDLVAKATHIFAMTRSHQHAIEQLFPAAAEKTFLVCEFCDPSDVDQIDVPDPIGMGRTAYLQTRDRIKKAIPPILNFLEQTDTPMTNDTATTEASESGSTTKLPSIIVGADHGGYQIKDALVRHLRDRGYDIEDAGTNSSESVDYPDYADVVSDDVAAEGHDLGILVCTTGVGMSIAANRNDQIRAAFATDADAARMTRRHNDANVLCLAGGKLTEESAVEIADAWLESEFEGGTP